jgi:hypothetical protein
MNLKPITLLIILSIIFFNSCSHQKQFSNEFNVNRSNVQNNDIIVFIPGYKGSKLINSNNQETVWLSLNEILSEKNTLELKNENPLIVGEIFDKLSIIPWIYELDIYENCLNDISITNPDSKISVFTYDWRLSNLKNAEKLQKFLQSIESAGAKSISIIAHSMGGLPLSYLISKEENLPEIKNIIFLTVPFKGTVTAFIDMQRDIKPILFNNTLLTKEVFNSFESAYEFLPHPEDQTISDINLKNKNTIYSIHEWDKNSWGILKNPESKKNINFLNFLSENLNRNLERYKILENNTSTCPTNKIVNIYGTGNPVKETVKSDFIQHLEEIDIDNKYSNKTDGDILISVDSAKLPKSLKSCENEEIAIGNLIHDRACNHQSVIEIIKKVLNK